MEQKALDTLLLLPMSGEQAVTLTRAVSKPLMDWYRESARDLPWRKGASPYHTWISEVMLQQTRVEAVKPYYRRFLDTLPDLPSLAAADEEILLKLWEGLGYYSRARNLQRAARQAMNQYGGALPASYEKLLSLSGFGEYTAGAVASIAFGIRVPAVDGNVLRVFSRLLRAEGDVMSPTVRRGYRLLLLEGMPEENPGLFNQAVMELGATVCAPGGIPNCGACPLLNLCRAAGEGNPTAYPVKTPKKARRVEERTVFVLVGPDGVFLRKRPDGLLGGLWEFPNEEGRLNKVKRDEWLINHGVKPERVITLKPAKHIFSHVEWRMTGFLAVCQSPPRNLDGQMVRFLELETQYALPSAFSAYRTAVDEYQRGNG